MPNTKPQPCPICEHNLNFAQDPTAPEEAFDMEDGIISICVHCTGLLVWQDASWSILTPEQWDSLDEKTQREINASVELVKAARQEIEQ